MQTRLGRFLLSLGFLFFWPSVASADYASSRAGVETAANATTQSALIYGGAIVLAGVAIAAGIYLGLRNKK